jgi:anion-transporting  ArsA/GET3 family ATPase
LGVGEEARDKEVRVATETPGSLHASILDARATFNRLVERYAPDEPSRRRILNNRFYNHLAGSLAGVLEYMAVERLYEVWADKRYDRIILDTPPTSQALDFLEAPERIVGFLDSGALRIALRPWFDEHGHIKGATKLGFLGKRFEAFLDRMVGLGLLRDMAEFFQAFGPLFEGFRGRAVEVQNLLQAKETLFVLVSGPGDERIPDTMFFARRLEEAGYNLGPVIVNRVHPFFEEAPQTGEGESARQARRVLEWLGKRDQIGLDQLRNLLAERSLIALPLLPVAPTDLVSLRRLGSDLVSEYLSSTS